MNENAMLHLTENNGKIKKDAFRLPDTERTVTLSKRQEQI